MQVNNVGSSNALSYACTSYLLKDAKTISETFKERGIDMPSVKLEISKEALEAYKQMFQPDREEQNRKFLNIRLMPDGMSFGNEDWPDMEDFLNFTTCNKMMYGKLPQAYYDSNVSIKDKASMLLNVYAETYDEIVKGYENGTREKYVVDVETEDLYRKVTMEEDLEYLWKEFESRSLGLERTHKYDCRDRADLARISMDYVLSGGLRKALEANMAYQRLKEEEGIVNIKQSLLDAAATFVSRYKESGFRSAMNGLHVQLCYGS